MKWFERARRYHTVLKGKVRPYRPYRCARCRTRKVLNRELWQYKVPPRCPCCNARDWCLDMHRFQEWVKREGVFETCSCDGAHFKHRIGSTRLCIHRPWYLADEPMPF